MRTIGRVNANAFKQAIDDNGLPEKVVMDKSGASLVGLENINVLLVLAGALRFAKSTS